VQGLVPPDAMEGPFPRPLGNADEREMKIALALKRVHDEGRCVEHDIAFNWRAISDEVANEDDDDDGDFLMQGDEEEHDMNISVTHSEAAAQILTQETIDLQSQQIEALPSGPEDEVTGNAWNEYSGLVKDLSSLTDGNPQAIARVKRALKQVYLSEVALQHETRRQEEEDSSDESSMLELHDTGTYKTRGNKRIRSSYEK